MQKPLLVSARSTADRLLGLRVRISPGAWMSVSCGCCVLSGSGLCDGPIPRPEMTYRACMWPQNFNEAAWVRVGLLRHKKKNQRNKGVDISTFQLPATHTCFPECICHTTEAIKFIHWRQRSITPKLIYHLSWKSRSTAVSTDTATGLYPPNVRKTGE
jgi:hypothetical protein